MVTGDIFSESGTRAGIPAVIINNSSNMSKVAYNTMNVKTPHNIRNQHVANNANAGILSNDSFINSTSDSPYKPSRTGMCDYRPPPSAPAGVNPRTRIKLFTSLQPRPYKIAGGDPTFIPKETPEASLSPSAVGSKQRHRNDKKKGAGEATKLVGRLAINSRNDQNTYKSIVHVPEQKLGAARTRILLSHDDMQM